MLRPRPAACRSSPGEVEAAPGRRGGRSAAEQPVEEGLRPRAGAALLLWDVRHHLLDVPAAAHPGRLAAAAALVSGCTCSPPSCHEALAFDSGRGRGISSPRAGPDRPEGGATRDSSRRGTSHDTQERDVAPEGALGGGPGSGRLDRPRRGLPRHRPRLGLRGHRPQQPHQRRGDRHRPHLADARHAGRVAVRHRPDHGRVRPRPPEGRGREGPRERLLLEEDRQALRRRHDLPGLQGAAPRTGTWTPS